MTHQMPVTASGYLLDRVFAAELRYRTVAPKGDSPEVTDNVRFAWNWKFLDEGPDWFEVTMRVVLNPSLARPEEVEATAAAVFQSVGPESQIGIEAFVYQHGPAIIWPYMRQFIATLTGLGSVGQFMIPLTNVATLMAQMDPNLTTGARQLKERALVSREKKALPAGKKKSARTRKVG